VRGLAVGMPRVGQHVRGCPSHVTLVREGRVPPPQHDNKVSGSKLCSALGWASDEDCDRIFLLQGIAEEPPTSSLGQPSRCGSPRHKTKAKALLSFCSADDDYIYALFTSL